MNRPKTTFYTIEWNKETGEERKLVTTYTYYGGTHNIIDSHSTQPNDPEEIEIISAIMDSPTAHDREAKEDVLENLSKEDIERIENKIRKIENEDNREYERD